MAIEQEARDRANAWLNRRQVRDQQPEPTATPAGSVDVVAVTSELAKRFEGLFLSPYLCPAGVPTIGYGATYYEDGTRVTLKDRPITKERAEQLLSWMVRTVYLPAVLRLVPGLRDPLLIAALADFAFNLGEPNLRGSTLRKKVNAGLWDEVPAELMKWVNAGGRKLRGLVLRRRAEVGLKWPHWEPWG